MSSVLVFWCLVLDLRLDFLVYSVYLGFLVCFVCSRRYFVSTFIFRRWKIDLGCTMVREETHYCISNMSLSLSKLPRHKLYV
jgi:hypothetical protein